MIDAVRRLLTVRPWGLRGRLLAGFLAVALLSCVLASGFGYVLARRAILRGVQDQILNTFRARVAQAAPANMSAKSVGRAVLGQIATRVGNSTVAVYVDSGPGTARVTAGSLAWPYTAPPPRFQDLPAGLRRAAARHFVFQRRYIHGRPMLLAGTPVDVADPARGYVHSPVRVFMLTRLDPEARQLSALARSILLASLVALAVAAVVALLAARGVLVPVRRLGRAAMRLGMGEFDTRVPVRGRDELAQLGELFNMSAAVLRRNVTELREAEAQSRRFVSDVSHELRTPLTAMTAVTELLADDTAALPGEAGDAARLVVESTRRLSALVADLIEVSRFDTGTAGLVLDDVTVARVIDDCLAARGWTEEVEPDVDRTLTARLDPRRFDVVVANLVGNALRHGTPPVVLQLAAATREGTDGLSLRVGDAGPGIPPEVLPHVFERFYKADAARPRSAGSGLGLAIARANVLLHGGTIDVTSSAAGTWFTVWLPTAQRAGTEREGGSDPGSAP